MAQRSVTVCDINMDDGEASDVPFEALGGKWHVELCDGHAQVFHGLLDDLAPFLDTAQSQNGNGGSVPRPVRSAPDGNARTVREWARSQGMQVSDRGRPPRELLDAYRAAH